MDAPQRTLTDTSPASARVKPPRPQQTTPHQRGRPHRGTARRGITFTDRSGTRSYLGASRTVEHYHHTDYVGHGRTITSVPANAGNPDERHTHPVTGTDDYLAVHTSTRRVAVTRYGNLFKSCSAHFQSTASSSKPTVPGQCSVPHPDPGRRPR